MLSLRQWIAISGAAVGPGRGQSTRLGTALLYGLANLRTGYWWDSGITAAARSGLPRLSFLRRLLSLIPQLFPTQTLLISRMGCALSRPLGSILESLRRRLLRNPGRATS